MFNEQQYVVCFEYVFACSVKLEVTVMYMHMKCHIFIVDWLYQESDLSDQVEKVWSVHWYLQLITITVTEKFSEMTVISFQS
jgi:hypothetical protein